MLICVIRQVINNMASAALALSHKPGTLALLFSVYLTLLLSLYLFIVTREARWWQVILTLLLGILAPVLFFLVQAMAVSSVLRQARPGAILRQSLHDSWKLAAISLPLILVAIFVFYLLSFKPASDSPRVPGSPPWISRWPNEALMTIQSILLYLVLPLVAVHLWIAVVRQGRKATFGRLGGILLGAFAPASILTYSLGLMLFTGPPYLLLFSRTPVSNAWLEIGLLGVRLALAFLVFVFGWLLTLQALAIGTSERRITDGEP